MDILAYGYTEADLIPYINDSFIVPASWPDKTMGLIIWLGAWVNMLKWLQVLCSIAKWTSGAYNEWSRHSDTESEDCKVTVTQAPELGVARDAC